MVVTCLVVIFQGCIGVFLPLVGHRDSQPVCDSLAHPGGQWANAERTNGVGPALPSSLIAKAMVAGPSEGFEYSAGASCKTSASTEGSHLGGSTRVISASSSGAISNSVRFGESDPPSGTSGPILIVHEIDRSTSSDVGFLPPIASSSYLAGLEVGYTAGKLPNVDVSGVPANSVPANSTIKKYSVGFVESGLPKGTVWSVTLTPASGTPATKVSNTSKINFGEPNGTYTYSIAPVQGYKLSVGSPTGTVTVGGSSSTITVQWAATSSPTSGLSRLDYVIVGVVVVVAGLVGVILWLRHRNRTPPDTSPPVGTEGTGITRRDEIPRNAREPPATPNQGLSESPSGAVPLPDQK